MRLEALRRQDPRRSTSRREPAEPLRPSNIHGSVLLKLIWESSFVVLVKVESVIAFKRCGHDFFAENYTILKHTHTYKYT